MRMSIDRLKTALKMSALDKKDFVMKIARKATFNQILRESKKEADQALWDRACTANQLAKIASNGRSRRAAYDVKQKALEQAVKRGGALVKPDRFSEQPLLSIEFSNRKRLHSLPRHSHRFAG